MKVAVERETDPRTWGALNAADPDASIFHDPLWLGALLSLYREFQPHHLVARDETGRLLGGLPAVRIDRGGLRQILSLPFGSYGTPLVAAGAGESPELIRGRLVEAWRLEARRAGVVRAYLAPFARHAPDPARARLPGSWRRAERTHLIPLDEGFEKIWFERYDKENRTASRKAVRLGVVVTPESGPAAAEILESLYRHQAREWTWHALYRYGLFRAMLERLGERARLWIARHQEQPVFAVLAFQHKDTVMPWVSGASPGARALCAGNLIHKVIIEDACRRGSALYNFGSSGGLPGIEAFKVAFGGEPFDYFSYFHEVPLFGAARRLRRRVLHALGRG